tara:strand:- start:2303 stop:4162 length:1860 start_codon:yes stop_codon:yes gene_type:complete
LSGAIQLTEVDFEQIKTNLIDYLRSTKQFTDYDFSGSNLQVILDLIAYQGQLNAYSTNMIANESFLSSATLRDNVVANARAVGYTPVSARSATSTTTFSYTLTTTEFPSGYPSYLELQPGAVWLTASGRANFAFNIVDSQTAPVSSTGVCTFSDVVVYEGTYLNAEFTVNTSDYNQKFLLKNRDIDSTSIRVEVQQNPNEEYNTFFEQANNLVKVGAESTVYWLEETNEEYYELTFGDGFFGKALKDGAKIFVTYVVTKGALANGINCLSNFAYTGDIITSQGERITVIPVLGAASDSASGADIESVNSVKFNAPKYYGAQNRCVISQDYETIIRQIYPAASDIYVYGGEELSIPEYGRVFIAIKPTTGESLSALTKNYIIESLNAYRIASLQIVLMDPSILYLEYDTVVYYNDKATIKDASGISSEVNRAISSYFISSAIDKFGGAARYSRIVGAIDDSDPAITRNTTVLRMRKDFKITPNAQTSYEICFEQALKTDTSAAVVYSTGFQLLADGVNDGRTYYFEDDTKGNVYLFYLDATNTKIITNTTFGTVDYTNGEVMIGYSTPVTFINTVLPNSVIQIRAIPFGQDVVAKQSVYLELDSDASKVTALVDTNVLSS